MIVDLEDFKTGWYGITIGLNSDEISRLINRLNDLKEHKNHFHFRSDVKGKGGVADIEFYVCDETKKANMKLE